MCPGWSSFFHPSCALQRRWCTQTGECSHTSQCSQTARNNRYSVHTHLSVHLVLVKTKKSERGRKYYFILFCWGEGVDVTKTFKVSFDLVMIFTKPKPMAIVLAPVQGQHFLSSNKGLLYRRKTKKRFERSKQEIDPSSWC